MALTSFHLAIPVDDLGAAEAFYGGVLGCAPGRRSDCWIDFNFFGHQLVTHLSPSECAQSARNDVDGIGVPVPHFGVILDQQAWESTAARLENAGVQFIIEPTIRHAGKPGEQRTYFLRDPAGNALEFKSFANPDDVFAG